MTNTFNNILNTEKTDPLGSGTRQGGSLSPFLHTKVLDVLARVIRRKQKPIKTTKNEVQISILVDDIISTLKTLKTVTIDKLFHTREYEIHTKSAYKISGIFYIALIILREYYKANTIHNSYKKNQYL